MGRIALVLVLVAGVVLGLVAGARRVGSDGFAPQRVTVSGTATVSSAPDQALVTLGVRTEAGDPDESFGQASARTNAIMEAIGPFGIAEDDISTTDVSLRRTVDNRGQDDQVVAYVAESELEIVVRDLDRVGEVLDRAVREGANIVGGIEFRLADRAAARQRALRMALLGARAKAEALAGTAGVSVGDIVRIDETRVGIEPAFAQAQRFGLAAEGAALDVAPRDVVTRVSVVAIWELG